MLWHCRSIQPVQGRGGARGLKDVSSGRTGPPSKRAQEAAGECKDADSTVHTKHQSLILLPMVREKGTTEQHDTLGKARYQQLVDCACNGLPGEAATVDMFL